MDDGRTPELRRMMVEYGEDFWGSGWVRLYGLLGGNPLAAMPSLHFATSVMAAHMLAETGPVAGAVGWTYAGTLGIAGALLGISLAVYQRDLKRVLASTEEIQRRTQETAGGAEQQSNAVSQTTTSVEQMSAHIDSVSQNADAANKAAEAARQAAAQGLVLMKELIRGMERIRLYVETRGKKLRALGDRSHEISSIVETIGSISARTDMLPYSIDVVCLDQSGIVSGLSGFFATRGIDIAEVSTRSYPAAHTGAPMFSVQMIVNVPSRIHVAHLREEFMEFCVSLNLDAILEPVKS